MRIKIAKRVPKQKRAQKAVSKIALAVQTEHARVVVAVCVVAAVFISASQGMLTPVFAHVLKDTTSVVRTHGFMTMVPPRRRSACSAAFGEVAEWRIRRNLQLSPLRQMIHRRARSAHTRLLTFPCPPSFPMLPQRDAIVFTQGRFD